MMTGPGKFARAIIEKTMKKKPKEDVVREWSQLDIDLMFWQYSVGISEANIDPGRAFQLTTARIKHLTTMFKKPPTFTVNFKQGEGKLEIEKKPTPKP